MIYLEKYNNFANELKIIFNTFVTKIVDMAVEYHAKTFGENAYDYPDLSEEEVNKLNVELINNQNTLIQELANSFQNGEYKDFIKLFLNKLNEILYDDALFGPAVDYTADNHLKDPVDYYVKGSEAHMFKTTIIIDEVDSDDENVIKNVLLDRYKQKLDEQAMAISKYESSEEELEAFWDNVFFINMIDNIHPKLICFPSFISRKY